MKKLLMTMAVAALCSLSVVQAQPPGVPLSGYLAPYPDLQPDRDRDGAWLYVDPEWNEAEFNKVMIDDIVVFFHRESEYKGINPRQMMELADAFRRVLVETLEPRFPVVETSGKGVLRMRVAITNIRAEESGRGWFGKSGKGQSDDALGGAPAKSAPGVSLRDAMIEAELVNSTNDRRIGVLVDRLPRTDTGDDVGQASWKALEDTFRFYAARFRTRMEAAQTSTP